MITVRQPLLSTAPNVSLSLGLYAECNWHAVGDQDSRTKEDWVQAKRHVLAVLRIQTGRTLYDVLVSRPEEVDEVRWIEEVHRDIALENARVGRQGLPPIPTEAGYQIDSIRSCVLFSFHLIEVVESELIPDSHSMKSNPELSCTVSSLRKPVKSLEPTTTKVSWSRLHPI